MMETKSLYYRLSQEDNFLIQGAIPFEVLHQCLKTLYPHFEKGAIAVFFGKVREDIIEGKKVVAIHYECYEAMAIKVIKRLIATYESDSVWIRIYHSIGEVKAGEISLLVIVSTPHRKQSFELLQTIVERIKKEVPIWKKEIFEDFTYRWK